MNARFCTAFANFSGELSPNLNSIKTNYFGLIVFCNFRRFFHPSFIQLIPKFLNPIHEEKSVIPLKTCQIDFIERIKFGNFRSFKFWF
jgi:hypothetical protein